MTVHHRTEIIAEGLPAPRGHFSHAVVSGGLVYVSGLLPLDRQGAVVAPDDARGQAEAVFGSLETILAAAGSAPDRILKLTTYVTRIADRAVLNALRRDRWPDCRPASTLVEVSDLAGDGAVLEIDAIALAGPDHGAEPTTHEQR